MAPNSKKQKEIAHRRTKVANLYLQGINQQAIADELDCSVGTVNNDLKALMKIWRESASVDFDEAKSRELAKLDKLEAQAWVSFNSSMVTTEKGQGKRKQPASKKGDKAKQSETSFVKQIETAGDPRFLNIIENCIEKRCKILGIDSPSKVELTGSGGGPIEYKEKSNLAISKLAELIRSQGVSLQDEEEPEDD